MGETGGEKNVGDCVAVNSISIVRQVDNLMLFSGDIWECRLELMNLKDRVDQLQLELEPCEDLELKKCIISSKDSKTFYSLNNSLKKEGEECAIRSLKKKEGYWIDFTFFVKKQKLGTEQRKTFTFKYFLRINYWDENGETPLPDLCPEFGITIYPPLEFLLNYLLRYIRGYIDEPLPFGYILSRFQKEPGIELNKEVLIKLLEFLKNNNVINYEIESSEDYRLIAHNIKKIEFVTEPIPFGEEELTSLQRFEPEAVQEKIKIKIEYEDVSEKEIISPFFRKEINEIKELLNNIQRETVLNKFLLLLSNEKITTKKFEKHYKEVLTSKWSDEEKAKCIQAMKEKIDFNEIFKRDKKEKILDIITAGLNLIPGGPIATLVSKAIQELYSYIKSGW